MVKATSNKSKSIRLLLLVLGVIALVNIGTRYLFYRIDLTAEKRYTLTPSTKTILKNLDDYVYIKCYLQGDFPSGFKQLQIATKEMLDELVSVGGKKVQYDFINPNDGNDAQKKAELRKQLEKKGINPININMQGEDNVKEQIIYPWCLVSYKDQEIPVFLLNQQLGKSSSEQLSNSEALLEYNLIDAITRLTRTKRKKVAISEGNGELGDAQINDFVKTLSEDYDVARVDIQHILYIPEKIDALIIPKPTKAFPETEKFKIDQYIMNGGKVIWMVDMLDGDIDSLRRRNEYIAPDYPLNIDDQLFTYGARVNKSLIQDARCTPVPMVTGYLNNEPQTKYFPWMFNPVILPDGDHPIVKNMDAILTLFASTIDTVGAKDIRKTVLLRSSNESRVVYSPALVSLRLLKLQPEKSYFTKPNQSVAVLLEGNFTSLFDNRLAPETMEVMDSLHIQFKNKSAANKMIVIADGDMIKNPLGKKGLDYPCGYYPFTRQTFANKAFLLNCIEYLTDETGVIAARSKEVRLRLLDREKVKEEKGKWRWINIALPIALLLIAGFLINFIRERKFS